MKKRPKEGLNMRKNTIFGILLVCLAIFTNGCAGAISSRKTFSQNSEDIKAAQERRNERSQNEKMNEPPISAEEIPGGGAIIRTPQGGVETHFHGVDGESGVTIMPFLGSEDPHYKKGKRDAKRALRQMKKRNEEQYARERARLDSFFEHYNPYDFSGRYKFDYDELYERIAGRQSEADYLRYKNDRYAAGVDSVLGTKLRSIRRHNERQRIYTGNNRDVHYAVERALLDAEFGVVLDAPTGVLTPEGLDAYYEVFDQVVEEIRLQREYEQDHRRYLN